MKTNDITKYLHEINEGNHISCIYRTNKEMFSLLANFFNLALQKNKKCFYVLGEHAENEIVNAFNKIGLNLSSHLKKGSFLFLKKEDIYQSDGDFNPEAIMALIKKAEISALNEGYKGLWICGYASLFTKDKHSCTMLVDYEAKTNGNLQGSTINAACLYNELLFDKHILIEALRTHPHVYLYDRFVNNTYFAASENFFPLTHIESPIEEYQKLIAAF